MSTENVTNDTSQVRIDPNEEITDAKKLILLNQWKDKVQGEVDDYTSEKNKIMDGYKKQKEKFDKLLAIKIKKMKKFDGLINNRKKVLVDIIKEIDNLNPPKQEGL
jgi:hypothetical protein